MYMHMEDLDVDEVPELDCIASHLAVSHILSLSIIIMPNPP